MATEKVTTMVLNVDLQCPCCYKKVKKTLCKFPQIRDQIYNEKANTVTITVISCCPAKIRDKLCYKGGKTIKGIAIKEAPKPKDADKKKGDEKPEKQEKPKETGKPKESEKPKDAEKPKANGKGDKPKGDGKADKPKGDGKADKPKGDGAPPAEKPKEAPKSDGPKAPEPAAKPLQEPVKGPEPVPVGVPSVFPYVGPSYDSYATGPYYHGYGVPPPPQPCYEGYYGYGHGYGRGYYASRPDVYFSEENPQGCSIM